MKRTLSTLTLAAALVVTASVALAADIAESAGISRLAAHNMELYPTTVQASVVNTRLLFLDQDLYPASYGSGEAPADDSPRLTDGFTR